MTEPSERRILLTGATCYIGAELLRRLAGSPPETRYLARRPEMLEHMVGPRSDVLRGAAPVPDGGRTAVRAPFTPPVVVRAAPQVYWNAFTRATPLNWTSRLAGVLPVAAEIVAAVALGCPSWSCVR